MKKRLVVFSAFNGIQCCSVALQRVGYKPSDYIIYSSEIDPDAKKVIMANWPDTIDVGDIRFLDPADFKHVDIFFGGSPCQDMSKMGGRKGITTKLGITLYTLEIYMAFKNKAIAEKRNLDDVFNQSALYWEFIRMLRGIQKYNPNVLFLLENVSNSYWEELITNSIGVKPYPKNSKLTSGQSRDRNYWTNIPYSEIEDKGILLGDVIPGAVTGAGKHGKKNPLHGIVKGETKWKNTGWEFNPDNKAYCLVRSVGHYKNTKGEIMKFTPENCEVLQNLPIGYTKVDGLSNSKRIALLGNAWTVDILVEGFFKNIPAALQLISEPIYLDEIS